MCVQTFVCECVCVRKMFVCECVCVRKTFGCKCVCVRKTFGCECVQAASIYPTNEHNVGAELMYTMLELN
jgi:hypothetical protein